MKVNEAIADALATEADGPIFGLMGDANMAVWSALTRQNRSRVVWSRHDAAAVLMADGYAQATGKLAVATVTCGPGLASAANAIVTAARARSAVVIFSGERHADGGKDGLQALDQRLFARACEAEFRPLDRLETLAEDIAEGFYTARTRSCPVILNLPNEFWEAELKWAWEYRPSTAAIAPRHFAAAAELVEQLAARLVRAQRPVIVAGRGAAYADARAEIELLGDRVGALLATSLLGKGFFDGHPYDLGIAGSFSSAATEKLLAEADLVVGIGASLNFYTTEGGMLFPSAEIVRIDNRPLPPAIGFTPGTYLQGDAKATTAALLKALDGAKVQQRQGFRSAGTRQILAEKVPPAPRATDGIDPRELMHTLARCLPQRTQVVSGGGHFWAWPISYLPLPRGGRYQNCAAFASIGLALPEGIGAALGNPDRKTLVIEGDGSLLQSIQELHAAAQQRIPLVVLVMNDSGWGAEVHKLRWKDRNPADAQWNSPDFVGAARAFGAEGVRIERVEDLPAAIARGFDCGGAFLIDARISPSTVTDAYLRVHRGEPNQVPLLRPVT